MLFTYHIELVCLHNESLNSFLFFLIVILNSNFLILWQLIAIKFTAKCYIVRLCLNCIYYVSSSAALAACSLADFPQDGSEHPRPFKQLTACHKHPVLGKRCTTGQWKLQVWGSAYLRDCWNKKGALNPIRKLGISLPQGPFLHLESFGKTLRKHSVAADASWAPLALAIFTALVLPKTRIWKILVHQFNAC